MKKLMRNLVVLMITFSMLIVGSFASGGAEVQAATTPSKVVVKSAKANSSHNKISVSWKGVKNATGYQIIYRKTSSSTCKKISVRGKTSRTLTFDTNKYSCRLKVRAFRQVKVNGRIKTYYGKWSDVKVIKKKYVPSKTNTGTDGNTQNSGGGSQNSGGSSTGGEVWIPNSGKKYHSRSTCSGMKNPTLVSKSYAESMGYTPCKKCY